MYREIVRGNDERDTHYYITRGRVGARKREKDAEERNNKITVELQLRKRQQEERDKKTIQKESKKMTKCKKNTRDIPQREITKGDY